MPQIFQIQKIHCPRCRQVILASSHLCPLCGLDLTLPPTIAYPFPFQPARPSRWPIALLASAGAIFLLGLLLFAGFAASQSRFPANTPARHEPTALELSDYIHVGMSRQQVESQIGQPDHIQKFTAGYDQQEDWYYANGRLQVVFEFGGVRDINVY